MKKIILLFTALVSISNLSFGQVTYERSYSTYVWTDATNVFKTDSGLNYFTLDNITNVLRIYNESHVLIQTTNITLPTNYHIGYIFYPSDKLFNTDSLIEFVIRFDRHTSAPSNLDKYQLNLLNQNNSTLFRFGNFGSATVIKGMTNNLKLITSLGNNFTGNPSLYDVYTLTGTLSTVQTNIANNLLFGYPNPTENKITLTNDLENGENGILEVFDTNGKKVIQKNVVGENGLIELEITELSNGVYIYKLNGQTNRFIKK